MNALKSLFEDSSSDEEFIALSHSVQVDAAVAEEAAVDQNKNNLVVKSFWTIMGRLMELSLSHVRQLTVCFVLITGALLFYRGGLTSKDDFASNDVVAMSPFCDATGKCGEQPDIPSPRTVYSARRSGQIENWWKFQATLNETAQEYVTRQHTKPQLILLGDSIMESWLGTNLGNKEKKFNGIPAVFQTYFAKDYDPLVLAMSGDQTQHLLYRLQNGQLLPEYSNDPNTIFVVLIGTNNLGAGESPCPTAKGVLAVAEYLLKHTQGRVKLIELLPRGDSFRLPLICPNGTAFASFQPAIDKVNDIVSQSEADFQTTYGAQRLQVLDCGGSFVKDGEIQKQLMPDLLHPNAKGHELFAECILASFVKK